MTPERVLAIVDDAQSEDRFTITIRRNKVQEVTALVNATDLSRTGDAIRFQISGQRFAYPVKAILRIDRIGPT
jgi:hypothetical protein